MDDDRAHTLDSWKDGIADTLRRMVDGEITASRCGTFQMERWPSGIMLSQAAASALLAKLKQ